MNRGALAQDRQLFLAAGMQSGGTTLVSWCFLQRNDMDGVLDLRPDILEPLPETRAKYAWAKATIASFRHQEIAEYYRWQGWEIRPLLIVRDVSDIYASLSRKWYGIDGTTAEDPPLRLRLLRFLNDWKEFHRNAWPILRYESLVEDPEKTLRKACRSMDLPWDDGMIAWPKSVHQIADAASGSESFLQSLEQGRTATEVIRLSNNPSHATIPTSDLEWISEMFQEYNRINGYIIDPATGAVGSEYRPPSFEVTRRDAIEKELTRSRRANVRLQRILAHPVLGVVIRLWARFVNVGFREVLGDKESN